MTSAASQLADVVNRGFEWVKARKGFQRLTASKAPESERRKALAAVSVAATRLEKAFMALMEASGGNTRVRKKAAGSSVDWGKVAGAISKGAGVLEEVLSKKSAPVSVIDTQGHEVK